MGLSVEKLFNTFFRYELFFVNLIIQLNLTELL